VYFAHMAGMLTTLHCGKRPTGIYLIPAFIRTRALEPQYLVKTRHLLEVLWYSGTLKQFLSEAFLNYHQ